MENSSKHLRCLLSAWMNPNCAEFYQTPKQGFFFWFCFQFCDVVEVVIIHKMIYPGLTKLDMVVEKTQNPCIGQNL